MVNILIGAGADRFARGHIGTPPQIAKSLGRDNMVELLQIRGAYK